MSSSNWFLAAFLALLSLHLGLSMELPIVTWIGAGISVLGIFRIVPVERPTWGLMFVLFASGIFIGNQVLEDWALEGSWPQDNGLGAGFLLSLLTYLLWLFVAKPASTVTSSQAPLERDNQSILVWGLIVLLLMTPPDATVIAVLGVPVALLTVAAMLLASLVLIADRCAGSLLARAALLLPLLIAVPLTQIALTAGQQPIIGALGDLFPRSRNFTPTGFSPNQQLRASVFLRPSTRPVLRIQADTPPGNYLVGNRLAVLDEDLIWRPVERPLQSLNVFDAESLQSGELRFPIANHAAAATTQSAAQLTIHSLTSDNYIFVAPDTSHVVGSFDAMTRNASDVWTPGFERGADRRWQLEAASSSTPEQPQAEYLQLPVFWDDALQSKSTELAGDSPLLTIKNVLAHFLSRPYTLQTDFDPERPLHDFFLNDRAGYCFWFATATTLALRANGIPSRLVGGYAIHEQLDANLWLVRERDAHSWVEWQDAAGFWHTIDPTPPSMFGFFDGYQSSPLSVWYQTLAGRWQMLLDRILADDLTANLIAWGGLLILAFLFVREYRRIRGARTNHNLHSVQWQKVWRRFLSMTKLPENSAWTATDYADNLPDDWSPEWKTAALAFLHDYNAYRFAVNDAQGIEQVQQSLQNCAKILTA